MDNVLLRLVNINKKVSNYFFLKDINLDLMSGEILGIYGENGSGKSTLMNIIAGNISSDQGSVYLNDEMIKVYATEYARKSGIIKIDQKPKLFSNLTVAENIYFEQMPYKKILFFKMQNRDAIYTHSIEVMKKVGLEIDCHNIVKNLKLVEKQMLEITKAYVANARILLLDQPTAVLKDDEIETLFNCMKRLKELGFSMIYVANKTNEIKQICDRVALINDGMLMGIEKSENFNKLRLMTMMAEQDN